MNGWVGKRVIIIGAARQGMALARFLVRHGAQVVITDKRSSHELADARQSLLESGTGVTWVCGDHPLSLLDQADVVCPSGGVTLDLPLIVEARRRGIPLSNDSQIFLESAPCKVIGITGSAGKTTTTTLVGRIGEAATAPCIQAAAGNGDRQTRSEPRAGFEKIDLFYPHKVWVGGNIGNPLIDQVDQMGPDDLSVMELSSFQLEIMTRSPQVAAVLNITPNHLDRHGTMAAYTAAKARILENQTPGDVAVLGRDDPGSWNLSGRARGQIVSFGRRALQPGQSGTLFQAGQVLFRTSAGEYKPLLFREDILLRGEHNLYNVLAAGAIACAAGLPPKAVRAGVIGFTGVSHRLEFVRTWGGADWYNDSIATAPERTLAAIRSFNEPLVLLLGGRDKNLPWEDLAELVNSRVDHLIVFGEAAEKIVKVVEAAKVASRTPQRAGVEAGNQGSPAWEAPKGAEIVRCSGLRQAFEAAAGIVTPGDVVLLSPGGTSFDEFHDFEARGEAYRQWVKELP